MEPRFERYLLMDYYEGGDLVGSYETVEEATQAARDYDLDVDGECDIVLEGATADGTHVRIDDWRY